MSVVLHELDFHAAGLPEKRRVHAGEVLPVRRLRGLHPRGDKARVRRVDIVGTESQMAQVDFVDAVPDGYEGYTRPTNRNTIPEEVIR